MKVLIILGLIFAYIGIGLLAMYLAIRFVSVDTDEAVVYFIFWPLLLVAFVVYGPFVLLETIAEKIEDMVNEEDKK